MAKPAAPGRHVSGRRRGLRPLRERLITDVQVVVRADKLRIRAATRALVAARSKRRKHS